MQRFLLAVAVTATVVLAPAASRADDHEIAQEIARRLTTSGLLHQFSIGVKYKDGTAWLSGHVADEQQMATALQLAKESPDVAKVVNKLQLTSAQGEEQVATNRRVPRDPQVQPASATTDVEAPQTLPQSAAPQPMHRMAAGPHPAHHGHGMYHGVPGAGYGAPLPMAAAGAGPLPAHVPGTGGGIAPAVYDQPHLPNYAWPSYASHPNYAALTYPRQYSATAWPFIGPFYPYPQVPLGWRKVTLEWDDGWWFLDFKSR